MIGMIPRQMIERLSWTTGSFAVIQVMRLVNNVVLARLLSPPLFGLMLIVNSIRTGVELLSDVGINQNIISNKQGHTPEFYDTAWTIKVIRGTLLGAICFATSSLLARFFETPELATILPVIALIFIFTGFQSASGALLQKQMSLARISLFDMGVALLSVASHIALAYFTPTIWALVLGTVLNNAIALVASYLIIPGVKHRFILDRRSVREILTFGKWIFLSSVIYFLAMNFDRLYFAKQITLTMLGIYSIARSLADMLSTFVIRTSNLVLFPTVAAMQASGPEFRARMRHARRLMLALAAVGLAVFTSVSDLVIGLLYDDRYAQAGIMLPLMLLGVWISILGTVNDSILLGRGKPAYAAYANAAKLIGIVVGVPIAFHYYGLIVALLVLNAAEVVRYVVLWAFSREKHLAFGRDDLALTFLFLLAIVVCRELLSALGFSGGLSSLFPVLDTGFENL
jgi:O-antigen/teichoic acid export membrane protein